MSRMTTPSPHPVPPAALTSSPLTPSPTAHLRAVHRAMAELRRGAPVRLTGEAPLLVLPAETMGAEGLAAFAAATEQPGVLLLSPVRASAVLRRPVVQVVPALAFRLPDRLLREAALDGAIRGLADPTAEQIVREPPDSAPVPPLAGVALSLLKLARLLPAGLVAPPMRSAERPDDVLAVSDADIAAYSNEAATRLFRATEAQVPLQDAPDSRIVAFRVPDGGTEHLAILVGRPEEREAPLVRVHSQCFTGDLLGSLRCDCGPQLRQAIARMAEEGAGALLYLAQEGRGIGLVNKLRAYALQDRGLDTLDANRALGFEADERNFLVAATMLRELGLSRVRLLTNNPDKLASLAAYGIEIVGREAHQIRPNGVNDHYLSTKRMRFGHMLD